MYRIEWKYKRKNARIHLVVGDLGTSRIYDVNCFDIYPRKTTEPIRINLNNMAWLRIRPIKKKRNLDKT